MQVILVRFLSQSVSVPRIPVFAPRHPHLSASHNLDCDSPLRRALVGQRGDALDERLVDAEDAEEEDDAAGAQRPQREVGRRVGAQTEETTRRLDTKSKTFAALGIRVYAGRVTLLVIVMKAGVT